MEVTNLGCFKLSWRPISKPLTSHSLQRRMVVRAMRLEGDGDDEPLGRSVDESMIVLHIRIKEMKRKEGSDHHATPSDWMEWEKQYYDDHYDQDVCEAIGLLQCYLMSLRPSVSLGLLALVALSVIITFGVGLFHALEMAKSLLYLAFVDYV